MTELIVLGFAMLGIFICCMLAVIANRLCDIVKELRDLRLDGIRVHTTQFSLDIGEGVLDKIADKFTKKGAKRNGQRKAAKRN